jgi:hypothetical protein
VQGIGSGEAGSGATKRRRLVPSGVCFFASLIVPFSALARVRVCEATEQDLHYKLERAIEDTVFAQSDLDGTWCQQFVIILHNDMHNRRATAAEGGKRAEAEEGFG